MMEKKDTENQELFPTFKECLYTLLYLTKQVGDIVKEKIEDI